MITSLAEIGVRQLRRNRTRTDSSSGCQTWSRLESSEYGMRAWMVKVGDVEFEYMEPSDARGLIAGFLQKRGEGLHHLAFRVDDIVETLESLKRKRFPPINAEPISGAWLQGRFSASGWVLRGSGGTHRGDSGAEREPDIHIRAHGGNSGFRGRRC